MEWHSFEKCFTPCKAQIVLGERSIGGNIRFIKIAVVSPAGQNLEITNSRYPKTLVFDKFFNQLQHYWMFLFLKSIISDNYFPSL